MTSFPLGIDIFESAVQIFDSSSDNCISIFDLSLLSIAFFKDFQLVTVIFSLFVAYTPLTIFIHNKINTNITTCL